MTELSGPLFWPSKEDIRESIFKKVGGHYNIFRFKNEMRSGELLDWVGDSKPDEMNFWLFSTSGVHGTYIELEKIEIAWGITDSENEEYVGRSVTLLLIQPRIVSMTYGSVEIESLAHLNRLKELRSLSLNAVQKIGFVSEAQHD